MSDQRLSDDRRLDATLRREGEAWRSHRTACPPPELLMARGSEALDGETRTRLEKHLAGCAPCSRLAGDLDAIEAEEPLDPSAESRVLARVRPSRPGRIAAPWLGIAAAVALAAGLAAIWWSRPAPAPEATAQQTMEQAPSPARPTPVAPLPAVALWTIEPAAVRVPLSALGTPRSGEGPSDGSTAALIQALAPYQRGEFAAAAERLERFVRQFPDQPDAPLYLGVSYLMTERPSNAIAPLERARSLAPPDRRAEIDWYLAAAEQRTGATENSRARLRALCRGTSRHRTLACAAENALE